MGYVNAFNNYAIGLAIVVVLIVMVAVVGVIVFEALGFEERARKRAEKKAEKSLVELKKAQKQLMQEKNRLNAILSSMGEGLLVCNNKKIVLLLNQIGGMLLRRSPEEVIGKNLDDIITFKKINPKSGKQVKLDIIENTIQKGDIITTTPTDNIYCVGSNHQFPVSVITAPLIQSDRNNAGAIVLLRDASKELEIDKAKSEFVSLASHQLRTPLSTISWYAEMMLMGDTGKLNKDQKDYLEQIYSSNRRMTNLVNSLLNVSRIEMGTFSIKPEKVRVETILGDIEKDLSSQFNKREMKYSKIIAKRLPVIKADKNLLGVIIQNLLSNAIKYTPTGGAVRAEIFKDKKQIIIAVSDTGVGIPQSEKNKVFEKMFRASNALHSDAEGNGLGLYIVKSILDHAGGKIWFESPSQLFKRSAKNTNKRGCTFYVSLPVSGMKVKKGTKVLATDFS